MVDRRTFLSSLAALAAAGVADARAARDLHLLVLAAPVRMKPDTTFIAIESGFRIGASEVKRMTELLNVRWRETVARDAAVAARAASSAHGAVALAWPTGMVSGLAASVPFVSAFALPSGAPPQMFSVRASDAAKRRAVRLWQQRHPKAAVTAVEWHAALDRYGAEQLNARFAAAGAVPSGDVWAGWMAVKIAAESLLRGGGSSSDGAALLSLPYDGHKGVPLRFDAADRHLRQPLCLVTPRGELAGIINPDEGES